MGSDWAERFVRDLVAISEPVQRERRVVEWLVEIEPSYAVRVLAAVVVMAQQKTSAAEIVMLSLVNLRRYEESLGYQRLAELYRHADELDLPEVKALLLDGRAQRQAPEGDGDGNDRVEKTLGERKALATRPDRDLIDRLLGDRHPHVIRILLMNPRLVEADVVRLAAQRPISTKIIDEIVNNAKWMRRYRVKLALVSNPYTPTNVAVSLAGYLNKPDLRGVATNSTLSEALRAHAQRLLAAPAKH